MRDRVTVLGHLDARQQVTAGMPQAITRSRGDEDDPLDPPSPFTETRGDDGLFLSNPEPEPFTKAREDDEAQPAMNGHWIGPETFTRGDD